MRQSRFTAIPVQVTALWLLSQTSGAETEGEGAARKGRGEEGEGEGEEQDVGMVLVRGVVGSAGEGEGLRTRRLLEDG
jgi:hypothetical protein